MDEEGRKWFAFLPLHSKNLNTNILHISFRGPEGV